MNFSKLKCKLDFHAYETVGIHRYLGKRRCKICGKVIFIGGWAPFDYDWDEDFEVLRDK